VCDKGAKKDKRGHPQRNDSTRVVCLFKDKVVPRFDRATKMFIEQTDNPACWREQKDEPLVRFADAGRKREGDKKQRRGGPGQDPDKGADRYPAGKIEQQTSLFLQRLSHSDFRQIPSYGIVGVISSNLGKVSACGELHRLQMWVYRTIHHGLKHQ
jgi:hypothetical protein